MSEETNVARIKTALQDCCRGDVSCDSCSGKQCLIGFSKIVADYAGVKKTLVIPNGIKMVPSGDFKTYEVDDVARALAIINIECKNCMDNHDDNCIVNIVRSSLEVALTGDHLEFTGNPLMYLMSLTRLNQELGGKVMTYYNALKNA